ncbi:MAG: indole-3-glycerol phosphate synthase TrpC [Acidobacteria bacterium]|nr:indole-3-glycerol phosphate synthase TrpC [Acidobacteriota bacterium]
MTPDARPPDVRAAIVEAARRGAEERQAAGGGRNLERAAAAREPRGELFRARLRRETGCNVIAECKRRSPSRGILRASYAPARLAEGYAAAGAAAISVLTEPAFFDGALEHLAAVRAAVDVPALRKDFVVTPFQVIEARAHGADAVLLIAAALPGPTLGALLAASREAGLAALVEVHDGDELARALDAGADILGVNNRDLRTMRVDLGTSHALVGAIPDDVTAVAESGLRTADDLEALRRAGYDAFLIGESFMTRDDPGAALASLLHGLDAIPRGTRRGGGRAA